jgi:hypothetical protein
MQRFRSKKNARDAPAVVKDDMKTPREQYQEKRGQRTPAPPGGKARARQEQFEQERGAHPPAEKEEARDDGCAGSGKGEEP